jgi:dipeptidyl-peptidase 9
MSPQICPHNPDLLAFVSEGNLYVTSVKSCQEVRLTDVTDSCVTAGLPPYVIQEEFRRYSGFWWQPHKADQTGTVQYSILYEEVDESNVDIVRIPSYDGTSEEYRYPRAGDQNASSCLKLVSFKYDHVTCSVVNADSTFPSHALPDLRAASPDVEYLLRAGWYDQDVYWVQTLNRKQNQLDLVFFSISGAFPPQIVLQEVSSDLWVNVGDLLHFIDRKDAPVTPGSIIRFIWTSEESGFRHLYTVSATLSGQDASDTSLSSSEDRMDCISSATRAHSVQRRALTCGNWEVSDREVWVSEEQRLIYFVALKEIPLERHLYVTSLDADPSNEASVNPMKRLTESGFSHTYVAFDPCHHYFVNIQSNISVPPFGFIHRLTELDKCGARSPVSGSSSPKRRIINSDSGSLPRFKQLGLVASNAFIATIESPLITSNASLSMINDQMDLLPGLPKPELFTYQLKSSGDLVYGVIFKPEFMEVSAYFMFSVNLIQIRMHYYY